MNDFPQKDADLGQAVPTGPQPLQGAAPTHPQKDADLGPMPAVKEDLTAAPPRQAIDPDVPEPSGGNPVPPDLEAGTFEAMGAAWTAETIRTDAWSYTSRKRRELADEMFARLPDEARRRVWDRFAWERPDEFGNGANSYEALVLDEARQIAQAEPETAKHWSQYPLTVEDLDRRITRERKTQLETAQEILDRPGDGIAEFVGAAGRAMTDQASLMLAPFGGLASTPWKIIAAETALGAAGEALVLPREFEVAAELDQADPDIVQRLAMGAAMGAGISAGIMGIAKAVGLMRARRAGNAAAAREGDDALTAEMQIDDAEAVLTGTETVQQRLAPDTPPEPGTMGAILSGPGFTQVVEAGAGYTVVRAADGSAIRREGTRAWRNNNPGNIEYGRFAQQHGAIGTDGRFAVFPTYEAGRAAKAALLFTSKGYRGLTIRQAIARYAPPTENNTAAYTRAITSATGAAADTPLMALTPKQREVMLNAMEQVEGFRPGKENGVQAAAPRRGLVAGSPRDDLPRFAPTTRGYTQSGQIRVGDDTTIDVHYEVVDATSLSRATGDLQPRDRSQINSDIWIAETAARLDPAQLGRSPNASTGAPLVGPDNVVESGNGRLSVINRAYELHPDRAAAYRAYIEAEGFAIPEGVQRPVLIARRRTELDQGQRVRLVNDAQDSGVAVMRPIEAAKSNARALTDGRMAQFRGDLELDAPENAGFVREWLGSLSKSVRNAVSDGDAGLNSYGRRLVREAIFARAWPDDDLIEMMTEGASGELKSLMDALIAAAPDWAALRADIAAGRVAPEFDLTEHVLGAMQAIVGARRLAREQKQTIAAAMADLLDSPDLLDGALPPVTIALLKKFWRGGRTASADEVADFLRRYAAEARRATDAKGGFFDAPSPMDALRAIDPKTFGDLPDDLAAAMGARATPPAEPALLPDAGYDRGADSPEAIEADAAMAADLLEPVPERAEPVRADPDDDPMRAEMDRLQEEFSDLEIEIGGATWTARDMLDDLDADAAADAVIQACGIGPRGGE